jgi:hypothetical protein
MAVETFCYHYFSSDVSSSTNLYNLVICMLDLFWLTYEGIVLRYYGMVAVRQLLRSCFVYISSQLPVST